MKTMAVCKIVAKVPQSKYGNKSRNIIFEYLKILYSKYASVPRTTKISSVAGHSADSPS